MKTCKHPEWIKDNNDAYCIFIQDSEECIDICQDCFESDPKIKDNTVNLKTNYMRETFNKKWC